MPPLLRTFYPTSNFLFHRVLRANISTIKVTPGSLSNIGATRPQRRALLTIRPTALAKLKQISLGADEMIKITMRKKGCSGSAYSIETAKDVKPLDEVVVQDGVKVVIDAKALLGIIGTEMDYVQDKLAESFVFYNPNIKETCGCGLSFKLPE